MFTIMASFSLKAMAHACYNMLYAAIMLPLNVYYAAINVKSILCCYYVAIISNSLFSQVYLSLSKKD